MHLRDTAGPGCRVCSENEYTSSGTASGIKHHKPFDGALNLYCLLRRVPLHQPSALRGPPRPAAPALRPIAVPPGLVAAPPAPCPALQPRTVPQSPAVPFKMRHYALGHACGLRGRQHARICLGMRITLLIWPLSKLPSVPPTLHFRSNFRPYVEPLKARLAMCAGIQVFQWVGGNFISFTKPDQRCGFMGASAFMPLFYGMATGSARRSADNLELIHFN